MKPVYNLRRFMLVLFYSGKVGFFPKRALWKSKCFSGLQTTLGENREYIGIYEPKAILLISVGKCIGKRRLWKGSFLLHSGFVGLGGGRNVRGDIFTMNVDRRVTF